MKAKKWNDVSVKLFGIRGLQAFRASSSLASNISGVCIHPACVAGGLRILERRVKIFLSARKIAERQQRGLVFTKSFLVLSFGMFDEVVVLRERKLSH